MNELTDTFTRATNNEPRLHTSRQDILRAGRSRQRRHTVLSAVAGAGVATLAVTAVLVLSPHATAPVTGTAGATGASDTSATVSESPTPSESPTTESPTTESPTTVSPTPVPATASVTPPETSPSLSAHADEVTANHKAKFSAIVTALTTRLAGAGYAVASIDSADSELAMSPTGIYDVRLEVTKGGQRGRIIVSSQSSAGGEAPPTICNADMFACTIVATVGGGTARYNSDDKASSGGYGRHVAVWWSGVLTQAQYLNMPADLSLKLSDDLLLSLATDPSLDLSHVLTYTDAEVRSFNLPSPTAGPPTYTPTTAP